MILGRQSPHRFAGAFQVYKKISGGWKLFINNEPKWLTSSCVSEWDYPFYFSAQVLCAYVCVGRHLEIRILITIPCFKWGPGDNEIMAA